MGLDRLAEVKNQEHDDADKQSGAGDEQRCDNWTHRIAQSRVGRDEQEGERNNS